MNDKHPRAISKRPAENPHGNPLMRATCITV